MGWTTLDSVVISTTIFMVGAGIGLEIEEITNYERELGEIVEELEDIDDSLHQCYQFEKRYADLDNDGYSNEVYIIFKGERYVPLTEVIYKK